MKKENQKDIFMRKKFPAWEGWLFLEEASAEKIIREHLIRWFAPQLQNRLRTLSARGISRVKPHFDDFHRLFLFAHLEPSYKNRAWVLVDGDSKGREVAEQLRTQYVPGGWQKSRFNTLSEPRFENYYPTAFSERVQQVFAISDKEKRREAKQQLFNEVEEWICDNEAVAKREFSKSAKGIISHLREMETILIAENKGAKVPEGENEVIEVVSAA